MTFAFKNSLERKIIFNDAIVDDCDFACLMGVGILIRWSSMGRPSSMTYPHLPIKDFPSNQFLQLCQFSFFSSDFDFAFELRGKLFPEKDGHAGDIETSRVMAIKPEMVKAKGEASFPEMPRFEVVAHPERYFPSGVIGDPTQASADKGQTVNKYVIEQVGKLVDELRKG